LFDPLDSHNMAETITKMLSVSDEEYASFCSNSRRLAEVLLSEDTFVEKYLAILNKPS